MADARIKISLASGELELQGPEAFISKYDKPIQEMLERLGRTQVRQAERPGRTSEGAGGDASVSRAAQSLDFGEALHGLPKNASGTDQILLAGKYAANASADGSFTTSDANQLLIGQGIKLSNPSQAMRQNLAMKRVFKAGSNRWRPSRQGEDHLKTLVPAG